MGFFHKTGTYVVFNEDVSRYHTLHECFVDFHYQNQSDPWYAFSDLSGIELKEAERNYEHREKVWDDLIKYGDTYSGNSFEFEIVNTSRSIFYYQKYFKKVGDSNENT